MPPPGSVTVWPLSLGLPAEQTSLLLLTDALAIASVCPMHVSSVEVSGIQKEVSRSPTQVVHPFCEVAALYVSPREKVTNDSHPENVQSAFIVMSSFPVQQP